MSIDPGFYEDLAGRLYRLLIGLDDRLDSDDASMIRQSTDVRHYRLALEETTWPLAHHTRGEPVSTATAEATVNRSSAAAWSRSSRCDAHSAGARLLVQARTRVLSNDLAGDFARWYPGLTSSAQRMDVAAWPHAVSPGLQLTSAARLAHLRRQKGSKDDARESQQAASDRLQGRHGVEKDVEEAVEQAGLEPKLGELVRIRVSQLNGCAFCLRMHTRDALAQGETTDRLAVVAAWWESQYFTEQEQAALALAEEVTRLPVPERREWDNGSLSDEQVSAISWLAIVMNALNRIAIRSHYPVAP